jgi:large subunit ribosomal protein L4
LYVDLLTKLSLTGQKTLLVMPGVDRNVVLASRNLQRTKVILAENLNTYEILNANKVIFAEDSLAKITELLKKD